MSSKSTIKLPVTKVYATLCTDMADELAVEEPLEIRLVHGAPPERRIQNISVTMRTPGNDPELAAGFLFTEGIISKVSDIDQINHTATVCSENRENVITVTLKEDIVPQLKNMERNFYTTSSCGVCGKGSIDAIRTVSIYGDVEDHILIDSEILHSLPDTLSHHQDVFSITGGLHACALFSTSGNLLMVREDVGRHNALDKLIGTALNHGLLPLTDNVLLLSGRASFELVQKAAMAGICVIAAVGAPSSLAVELATEFNITLIGFLRNHRFNIYTAPHRVVLQSNKIANSPFKHIHNH
ncbi:formate dehydrogenase accessory sulfurtransferase FdhD [Mucilaginibacter sp. dw_454]|uniref:formate dehydrogenase accessory sulfurtransferase FdhD n=1 Tax=Mucilaginibacter sp. dw_454 TaxID=2720079 RepID=UPI001BD58E5F|nr:formate dehydrogenase accessory sulfurtransferase FdhD [Mucilaginibacter sp. dw_454]